MFRTALVAALLLAGTSVGSESEIPDTGKILRLQGRFGGAHACPVAPDLGLTAAHVVDPKPFEPTPLLSYRFESVNSTSSGVFKSLTASLQEDLAAGKLLQSPVPFYPIAPAAPKVGDRVWWIEYDWARTKAMFSPIVRDGKVIEVFAGTVIVNAQAANGASGSCLLNEHGEAVAVVAFGKMADTGNEVMGAVLLTEPWLRPISEVRKELGLE